MTTNQPTSLLDRTMHTLLEQWRRIADAARLRLAGSACDPSLPEADLVRVRARVTACIEARGGDVSARARAADLGHLYLALDEDGKHRFLSLLAEEFATDQEAVSAAAAEFLAAEDDASRRLAEAKLREALIPPRARLLTQFTALPDGVKFLVDLRADVLQRLRGDVALQGLDDDLRRMLAAWFDVGFLELRRITWDTSAALLEKLIRYEAVHAIQSWQDLKNRLDSDRRCFAFFHPRMPDEPLIFVEVALVTQMAGNIQALLDESAAALDPQEAKAAIFYSISNAQRGLAGISFGNFLIKRVVDLLAQDFPRIEIFATLSPVPGFRSWIEPLLADPHGDLLLPAEAQALLQLTNKASAGEALASLLAGPWPAQTEAVRLLEAPLTRLCARYLVRETRADGRPQDAVARFHLSNGARIERINWLGDTSAKGLRESAGMMVNYLYKQSEIEINHEAYASDGKVAASSVVLGLARR
ncbi:MAG: malonyl-CoA decarboxylase [Gammaproteobacteria bacterium]|nr:malonyl-CoA decarboxylase [Gammaproteobacteria bacterium]